MKSVQKMESAQEIRLPEWWQPISEQPISKSQHELDILEKLSKLEIPLRDDQILRMNELKKFFAERIEKIRNN